MESPMLRAGVAAVQAALAVRTPQKVEKNEDGGCTLTPPKVQAKIAAWLLI